MTHFLLSLLLAAQFFPFPGPGKTTSGGVSPLAFDAVGPAGGGGADMAGNSIGANFGQSSLTLSWTHVVGTSADPLLFVGIGLGSENGVDSQYTITITYNGVAMSPIQTVHNDGMPDGFTEMFGLINPSTGSNTVVATISWPSNNAADVFDLVAGSVSFTGGDQTTGWENIASSYGYSGSPSLSLSSATGHYVVDMVSVGSPVTSSNQTQEWLDNPAGTSSGSGNGAQSIAAGSSTVTMSYNVTSDYWGMVAVDVLPF